MKTKSLMAAMVLSVTAALAPTLSTPAAAKTCKPYYMTVTGGKRLTNLGARLSARTKWRQSVRTVLGWRWSLWTRARSRHYSCWKEGAIFNKRWRCKAIARPCK